MVGTWTRGCPSVFTTGQLVAVLSVEKWNCLEEGGHRRGGYAFMMS